MWKPAALALVIWASDGVNALATKSSIEARHPACPLSTETVTVTMQSEHVASMDTEALMRLAGQMVSQSLSILPTVTVNSNFTSTVTEPDITTITLRHKESPSTAFAPGATLAVTEEVAAATVTHTRTRTQISTIRSTIISTATVTAAHTAAPKTKIVTKTVPVLQAPALTKTSTIILTQIKTEVGPTVTKTAPPPGIKLAVESLLQETQTVKTITVAGHPTATETVTVTQSDLGKFPGHVVPLNGLISTTTATKTVTVTQGFPDSLPSHVAPAKDIRSLAPGKAHNTSHTHSATNVLSAHKAPLAANQTSAAHQTSDAHTVTVISTVFQNLHPTASRNASHVRTVTVVSTVLKAPISMTAHNASHVSTVTVTATPTAHKDEIVSRQTQEALSIDLAHNRTTTVTSIIHKTLHATAQSSGGCGWTHSLNAGNGTAQLAARVTSTVTTTSTDIHAVSTVTVFVPSKKRRSIWPNPHNEECG